MFIVMPYVLPVPRAIITCRFAYRYTVANELLQRVGWRPRALRALHEHRRKVHVVTRGEQLQDLFAEDLLGVVADVVKQIRAAGREEVVAAELSGGGNSCCTVPSGPRLRIATYAGSLPSFRSRSKYTSPGLSSH